MNVTVMTFNLRVHVEQDGDNAWPYRNAEAAEAIKEAGAAIVCTQEGTYAMLQDLQALLSDYAWLGKGRQGGHEDEHCAVFYRREWLEPVESGNFGLSEYPDRLGYSSWNTGCPRICTWARLRQQDGRELYVFNTHLDHRSEEARTNGIRLIVERIRTMCEQEGIPAILAGDFNSGPDSEVIAILTEAGLSDTYAAIQDNKVGCTFHDFCGGEAGEPIDYIFVTPDVRVRSVYVDRSMYNGRYPSDHYPVVATL
ncbi:endonuclease/exonuclease/phosphatase family protein [Paenibacillus sp. GCM10027628]|uniref:endonuclease/exonuclease/phosphatase family protein n=1 Tax=Paenibacillus sp. GCM10027628 TaxID=3273413 RepID=UPI0036313443